MMVCAYETLRSFVWLNAHIGTLAVHLSTQYQRIQVVTCTNPIGTDLGGSESNAVLLAILLPLDNPNGKNRSRDHIAWEEASYG